MDYQLKRPARTCAATGEDLLPGSTCYSALVEDNGRFVRLDFSEQGWDGPPEDAIGYWRRTVPADPPAKPKPLETESLLQHFEQLTEDANPSQEKLRYVLALLLLQKRRLQMGSTRSDGEIQYLQLIGSRGEGPYEVREFPLSEDDRQTLQCEVDAYLAAAEH